MDNNSVVNLSISAIYLEDGAIDGKKLNEIIGMKPEDFISI